MVVDAFIGTGPTELRTLPVLDPLERNTQFGRLGFNPLSCLIVGARAVPRRSAVLDCRGGNERGKNIILSVAWLDPSEKSIARWHHLSLLAYGKRTVLSNPSRNCHLGTKEPASTGGSQMTAAEGARWKPATRILPSEPDCRAPFGSPRRSEVNVGVKH